MDGISAALQQRLKQEVGFSIERTCITVLYGEQSISPKNIGNARDILSNHKHDKPIFLFDCFLVMTADVSLLIEGHTQETDVSKRRAGINPRRRKDTIQHDRQQETMRTRWQRSNL